MTPPPMVQAEEPIGTKLSVAEQGRLSAFEAVIKRGLQSFVEVGNALAAIRDGKLYRGTYRTFEDYCRERWGIQRAHAYRLIEGARVVENLSPVGDKLPKTERQARPLTKLKPNQQRAAWSDAVEMVGHGQPTAAHIEKAIAEFAEREARDATHAPAERAPLEGSGPAPKPFPNDRLACAKLGISSLINTRAWVRENYGALTGRHSDTLAFERDVEKMLEPLRRLESVLEKGATA